MGALEILEERLARGEITLDEFEAIKGRLRQQSQGETVSSPAVARDQLQIVENPSVSEAHMAEAKSKKPSERFFTPAWAGDAATHIKIISDPKNHRLVAELDEITKCEMTEADVKTIFPVWGHVVNRFSISVFVWWAITFLIGLRGADFSQETNGYIAIFSIAIMVLGLGFDLWKRKKLIFLVETQGKNAIINYASLREADAAAGGKAMSYGCGFCKAEIARDDHLCKKCGSAAAGVFDKNVVNPSKLLEYERLSEKYRDRIVSRAIPAFVICLAVATVPSYQKMWRTIVQEFEIEAANPKFDRSDDLASFFLKLGCATDSKNCARLLAGQVTAEAHYLGVMNIVALEVNQKTFGCFGVFNRWFCDFEYFDSQS